MSNGWKSSKGKLVIKRMSESEIDQAIADLEKRGYVLVKKSPVPNTYDQYNKESRKMTEVVTKRWQAELKKG